MKRSTSRLSAWRLAPNQPCQSRSVTPLFETLVVAVGAGVAAGVSVVAHAESTIISRQTAIPRTMACRAITLTTICQLYDALGGKALTVDYYYNAKLVICRIRMRRVTKLGQTGYPSAKPSAQAHLCDFAL